jgi:hypothetical protein
VERWRRDHGVEVIGPGPRGGRAAAGQGRRLRGLSSPSDDTPVDLPYRRDAVNRIITASRSGGCGIVT